MASSQNSGNSGNSGNRGRGRVPATAQDLGNALDRALGRPVREEESSGDDSFSSSNRSSRESENGQVPPQQVTPEHGNSGRTLYTATQMATNLNYNGPSPPRAPTYSQVNSPAGVHFARDPRQAPPRPPNVDNFFTPPHLRGPVNPTEYALSDESHLVDRSGQPTMFGGPPRGMRDGSVWGAPFEIPGNLQAPTGFRSDYGATVAADGTESRGGVVATVTNAQRPAPGSGFLFTAQQRAQLENLFQNNPSPSIGERQTIANNLGVHYSSVTNWFDDRRRTNRGRGR